MKKFSLIFLLIHSIIWAQQESPSENIKGKVWHFESKKYIVKDNIISTKHNYFYQKSFSKQGLLSEIKYMGDDDKLDTEEIYTYTSDGKLLKIETLKADGRISKTTVFQYDAFGFLTTEKKLNYKYDVESQTSFSYDKNKNLIQKEQFLPSIDFTSVDRFFYNNINQLVEYSKETKTGLTKERYTYNKNNQLFEKEEINAKNEKFSSILYEYNDKGDKTALFKFEPNGEMTYFEQYEFIYDSFGNWTEKKVYIKGDFSNLEKRKIKYYQ